MTHKQIVTIGACGVVLKLGLIFSGLGLIYTFNPQLGMGLFLFSLGVGLKFKYRE